MDIDQGEFEPRMRLTSRSIDQVATKESLFHDLISECRLSAPGARLSYPLRNRLERFTMADRKLIVSRKHSGCAPLFLACKKGNVEIVQYLIENCNADVEQRGMYEVPDDRSVHCVTPLWCAAVAGRLPVVRCLVEHSAKVNSVSDTGSTSVRSACFMTHLDIVIYLVDSGADILRPNYNGGTCLINSVQSGALCDYLLSHGATVNAKDIQNKTALHYAIQEHRFETTKLLLDHGSDPFIQSRYNDDALQTACLKGATQIFEYLISTVKYSDERTADAYELIGTTFLDEHHDVQMALDYWRKAWSIRIGFPEGVIHKKPLPQKHAFQNYTEFLTLEDINDISTDLDKMRIHSLLICERILGSHHKDMIFRLMYRGAAYADALQYQRCIDLWRYALELRIEKDSVLYSDTCFTAQALVRLFLDLYEKQVTKVAEEHLHFDDIFTIAKVIIQQVPQCLVLLNVLPAHKRQLDSFDRILKCVTHLLFLLKQTCNTKEQIKEVRLHLIQPIVHLNPKMSTGNTLLHLSVLKQNMIRSNYFQEEHRVMIFPSICVVKVLLEGGMNPNSVNFALSTPLHLASMPDNYNEEVIRLLLDYGAVLDKPNRISERPRKILTTNPSNTINLVPYTTLKCLAAQVIADKNINYHGEVPKVLEELIELHKSV